jgi:hypothetical protein
LSFKVGDRVVWISREPAILSDQRGVVTEIDYNAVWFLNETQYTEPRVEYDGTECFILEELYDSPLYRALRENDE